MWQIVTQDIANIQFMNRHLQYVQHCMLLFCLITAELRTRKTILPVQDRKWFQMDLSHFVASAECWAQGMLGKFCAVLYVQMEWSQSPGKRRKRKYKEQMVKMNAAE